MDQIGSREHEWQSADYAAYWVADAEARDHERTEQLALLANLIPFRHDAPIRVLDRPRLAAHAAQLDFALGDLSRPDWLSAVRGPYDVVVSAAVLHNLRNG